MTTPKITLHANAQAVLDVLRETDTHPTAQEIYETVRYVRPQIGLATVYRILHQLTEQGLIKELGDSEARYDAHTARHDHAVCTQCGALLDIPMNIVITNDVLQQAAQAAGVELASHELRIYGRCKACQEQKI